MTTPPITEEEAKRAIGDLRYCPKFGDDLSTWDRELHDRAALLIERLLADRERRERLNLDQLRALTERLEAAEARATRAEAERDEALGRLKDIGDFAHDRSTGPTIPDDLWEIRRMAYEEATQ